MKTENAVTMSHVGAPGAASRIELREALGLTGCEISCNTIPEGQAVPFVHAHKENEEVYFVLSGKGDFWLDGEVHPLVTGDAVRVAPRVERCLRASGTEPLTYICVQAREGATPNVTMGDGMIVQTTPAWG